MLGKHIKRLEINKSIVFHAQKARTDRKDNGRFRNSGSTYIVHIWDLSNTTYFTEYQKLDIGFFPRFCNYPLTIRFHNGDDISQCGREYIQWNKVILVKAFREDKTLISESKSRAKDFMMPREELFSRSRMRIMPAKFTFYKGGFHWIQVLLDGKNSLQTVK